MQLQGEHIRMLQEAVAQQAATARASQAPLMPPSVEPNVVEGVGVSVGFVQLGVAVVSILIDVQQVL